MRCLCFGSLNIDRVYTVDHMVRRGETLSSAALHVNCGGKGLNQSVALARAGLPVCHAGRVGPDGAMLTDCLTAAGVDVSCVMRDADTPSGHAIIQVDADGDNCILLYPGANRQITPADAERVLEGFGAGDLLMLQNEISSLDEIIEKAYRRGLRIALNPSPVDDALLHSAALPLVDWLILNEIEGGQLTGETEPERICDALLHRFPETAVVLTLGKQGAVYADRYLRCWQAAYPVTPVDTTAAGDTFSGYFLAALLEGQTPQQALRLASRAAALTICTPGAAEAIPARTQVEQALRTEVRQSV